jgi:PPOX class probable F420-dependent enzyme
MPFTIPDSSFGKRVRNHLENDPVAWLVTVTSQGTPQPSPIWFIWDGESALIYSLDGTSRTKNLANNKRASLHFDGNGLGGDIVVLEGDAVVVNEQSSADNEAYQEKYYKRITEGLGMTPESFAARYSVAIRFHPERVRGH